MSDSNPPQGWHIVRVTIEAASPLSCASGQGQDSDIALVRDANGLPMIPGTTLQGLLKRHCPADLRDDLFGKELGRETVPARLIFSNALVHNSGNLPCGNDPDLSDPLLNRLLAEAPLKREHVRLDHRHGAAKGGKFDRAAVPVGTRFSLEVLMRGAEGEMSKLASAISGLVHPLFRIGGSGRKGYGRIAIEGKVGWAFFGVDRAEIFRKVRAGALSDQSGMTFLKLAAVADVLTIGLELIPVQPWRTGQGPASHGFTTGAKPAAFPTADARAKAVDLIPLREPQIQWTGHGKGCWLDPSQAEKAHYVLPASGIRGPLLHRTIYHWNRINGMWAEDVEGIAVAWRHARSALNPLFGFVAEDEDGEDGETASVSPLFVDDIALEVTEVVASDHIRIDRFTGGVVQGALYAQELVHTPSVGVSIAFDAARFGQIDATLHEAFVSALRDLAEGRLALGAKSLGFCSMAGEPDFSGTGEAEWRAAWSRTKRTPVTEEAG